VLVDLVVVPARRERERVERVVDARCVERRLRTAAAAVVAVELGQVEAAGLLGRRLFILGLVAPAVLGLFFL
jgi:hypothetical protein